MQRWRLLRTISVCLVLTSLLGCASSVDRLKAHDIEFQEAKAVKVFRF